MSKESSSVFNAKVLVGSPNKRCSGLYSWDHGRKSKVRDKDMGVTDIEVVDATSEDVIV